MSVVFPRRLKVSKTDTFSIDVSRWLDGETLTGHNVTSDALTTVEDSVINGDLITVRLTGVTVGSSDIHFEYSTVARSDCAKAIVIVINDC